MDLLEEIAKASQKPIDLKEEVSKALEKESEEQTTNISQAPKEEITEQT